MARIFTGNISLNYFLVSVTLINDIFLVIEAMNYIYDIQNDINILSLRKICLKKMIDSTYMEVNYSKLAYHIVKHFHGPINVDLCFMILDCCCEHTVYINHFGLLTQVKIQFDTVIF